MIAFGNPWALIALSALAMPAIIHLLGRHRARVVKFPSVRFLTSSRLVPTRRTRLNDLPLLVARIGILAAAVVALAQPVFLTASRRAARASALNRLLTRVVIVDTSPSMLRTDSTGEPAIVIARRLAREFAGEATTSSVIETATPSRALIGAAEWVSTKPGRREIVFLSDFQVGTLDSVDLAGIPGDVGVRLSAIAVTRSGTRLAAPSGNRVAHVAVTANQSVVDWTVPETRVDTGQPRLLAGRNEAQRAFAARGAAAALGANISPDSTRPIVIVYKEYAGRASLAASARAIDQAWMGDIIARLHRAPTLTEAAMSAAPTRDTALANDRFSVVARDSGARPVIVASRGEIGGRAGLQFWVLTDAGSAASAALLASLPAAISSGAAGSELEPSTVSAELLARWQRPAGPPAVTDSQDDSDARWFWAIALALLAVETYMRQFRSARPNEAMFPDRDEVQRVA